MKNQTKFLLLNTNSANDNNSVRIWLKNNGFMTSEVTDIFQAMEEISDFTIRTCPEIVLIEAISPLSDFQTIQKMKQFSGNDEISVYALSENGKVINHKECFEGNFVEITAKLSLLHSKSVNTRSAA